MKLIKKIYQHRYFLMFILMFAYINSIYGRILVRQKINFYTFTPESALVSLLSAVLLFLIIFHFIKKWQKSESFNAMEMSKIFGMSLLIYVLIDLTIALATAFIFDNIERNFNRQTLTLNMISNLLDGLIYGSFFLVYYYYNKTKNHQRQLAGYHQALSESRIDHLKAQLNPHFLFNNLNVLDQLIDEDKQRASDFLNEFAEIYRYVLQATDHKVVDLNKELAFVEQYFRLIEHKYGNAYQLSIEHNDLQGSIVPLSLQLLVENAVQHNLGTLENPISIEI